MRLMSWVYISGNKVHFLLKSDLGQSTKFISGCPYIHSFHQLTGFFFCVLSVQEESMDPCCSCICIFFTLIVRTSIQQQSHPSMSFGVSPLNSNYPVCLGGVALEGHIFSFRSHSLYAPYAVLHVVCLCFNSSSLGCPWCDLLTARTLLALSHMLLPSLTFT